MLKTAYDGVRFLSCHRLPDTAAAVCLNGPPPRGVWAKCDAGLPRDHGHLRVATTADAASGPRCSPGPAWTSNRAWPLGEVANRPPSEPHPHPPPSTGWDDGSLPLGAWPRRPEAFREPRSSGPTGKGAPCYPAPASGHSLLQSPSGLAVSPRRGGLRSRLPLVPDTGRRVSADPRRAAPRPVARGLLGTAPATFTAVP